MVSHRTRRLGFLARTRAAALAAGGGLDLELARDVQVMRGVRLRVQRGTHSRVVIGPGCVLQEGVLIVMRGGTLQLGAHGRLRRGSLLKVDGALTIEDHVVIGYGNVVHCAASILIGAWSTFSEYVTIVDSNHLHDGEHADAHANVTTDPVVVGRNVWLASKATVLPGVVVGDNSVVAAHALVTSDVPEGTVAGGVPAKTIAMRQIGEEARRLVAPDRSAGDVERP